MKTNCYAILVVFFLLTINTSWAIEIRVSPGSGTLAAAIAGADNGDVLVLEDGGFNGSTIVNKSLTLRPVNRATNAIINDKMEIDGGGIDVII